MLFLIVTKLLISLTSPKSVLDSSIFGGLGLSAESRAPNFILPLLWMLLYNILIAFLGHRVWEQRAFAAAQPICSLTLLTFSIKCYKEVRRTEDKLTDQFLKLWNADNNLTTPFSKFGALDSMLRPSPTFFGFKFSIVLRGCHFVPCHVVKEETGNTMQQGKL